MPPPALSPVAIVGPTASGKSALALALARAYPVTELISVDSMQVYRGMDIGTAKPSAAEQAEVPHHGIDLVDPHEEFTLAQFQQVVLHTMADVESRGGWPVLVGGTGLYVQAVVDGLEIPGRYPEVVVQLEVESDTQLLHARLAELDPVAAARMEPTNRRRVLRALEVTVGSGRPFSSYGPGLDHYPDTPIVLVGLDRPRDVLDQRIVDRYHHQLEAGFLDEVQRLLTHPQGWSRTAAQALGYKELAEHLAGALTLDEALDLAVRRTRRFARRQQRWFRRDPRVVWFDADRPLPELVAEVLALAQR